ncbi:ornithine cyclodeaminase [Bradyrhizobium sp. 31Argb]|uniref:ornithine cyclodeaminase family protein n=1 Tax=Bradyrhizobium sp. 31Argb TaxID=3141247 RepID=UPI003749CAE2
MLPQLLTYEGCENTLNWPGAIDALRRGHKLARPQQGDLLLGSGGAKLLNRAARTEGLGFVIKGDSVFSGNVQKGLPSIQGAVLPYDPDCGSMRAVIESRLVTQYKTAADSVLGAQYLARANSRHLVIIGAGMVAATLARAYDAAFPSVERISIWSRRPEQAQTLAATLNNIRSEVAVVIDLAKAVGEADIVSAATMSQQPVLLGQWVRPGTHVDLIGAFTPDMREADDSLIASSLVYVDYFDTVVDKIGELIQPIQSGVITRDHVRGDLYDLVAADSPSRRSEKQITLFKNGGRAHLDLMIANYVVNAVNAAKAPTPPR